MLLILTPIRMQNSDRKNLLSQTHLIAINYFNDSILFFALQVIFNSDKNKKSFFLNDLKLFILCDCLLWNSFGCPHRTYDLLQLNLLVNTWIFVFLNLIFGQYLNFRIFLDLIKYLIGLYLNLCVSRQNEISNRGRFRLGERPRSSVSLGTRAGAGSLSSPSVAPVPVGVDTAAGPVAGRTGLAPHPVHLVAVLVSEMIRLGLD